ncbi:MAG: TIGR00159 family protein [Chloroflexi bacterium]|nr:TIGR00159 family protein [Chloroflexota bacterium]
MFFLLLALVRGTRAVVLLRGVLLLTIIIALLTSFIPLPAFSWLLTTTLPALLIAIPVIFAPELRRALERLGQAGAFLNFAAREPDVQPVIRAICTASQRLSDRRHGALIIIEREVGLQEYVDTGVKLDAVVGPELLVQIFYVKTPLHDGAAILRGNRVAAAACVMPLSSSGAMSDRPMGLRHRAALGITEVSDAVAVVVSEETGAISVAHNGRMIRRLDLTRLQNILTAFYRPRSSGGLSARFARSVAHPPPADSGFKPQDTCAIALSGPQAPEIGSQ